MQKKAIIFDFDGTIADTLPTILKIINLHITEFGYPKLTAADFKALRNKSAKEILAQYKIPIFRLLLGLRRGMQELAHEMKNIKIFAGMKDVLLVLQKKGYILGILSTNSKPNMLQFLKVNGLEKTFSFVHSEFNIFGKDNALRNLLRQNKLKQEEVIYVGDEVRDIEACHKVGVEIISVTWGFNSKEALMKHQPRYVITKPEKILSILL